jgi:hypothetical protein
MRGTGETFGTGTGMTEAYGWEGREVIDRDGERVGTIEALYTAEEVQRPEWAAVKTGLFGLHGGPRRHTLFCRVDVEATAGRSCRRRDRRAGDRVGTTAGLGLICLTSTTVVWIVWFRHAYRNLPRLAGVELRLGAGWAIGSWLVPILDPAPSP